jgi:hypothetical protein
MICGDAIFLVFRFAKLLVLNLFDQVDRDEQHIADGGERLDQYHACVTRARASHLVGHRVHVGGRHVAKQIVGQIRHGVSHSLHVCWQLIQHDSGTHRHYKSTAEELDGHACSHDGALVEVH